jgi:Protein of unknown function (DUF2934)
MIQHREPPGEEIARHAYELYIQRGGEHGKDVDDWLKAKKELSDEPVVAPAKSEGRPSGWSDWPRLLHRSRPFLLGEPG